MKNKILKALALFMALLTVLSVLAACNEPGNEGGSSEESTPPPAPVIEDIKIVENNASQYKVVRSESFTEYEKNAVVSITKAFTEKTGVTVLASGDFINEALGYSESEYEILIGKTNRAETAEVYSTLRVDDFAVTIVGKKIVIAAHKEEKMAEAVEYFLSKLQAAEGSATFLAADTKHEMGEYSVNEITLNGEPISKYTIIHNSTQIDAASAAQKLAEDMLEYGYVLNVKNDTAPETEYEIVIGATSRGKSKEECDMLLAKDYKIYVDGSKLYLISGYGQSSLQTLEELFTDKLTELTADGSVKLTAGNIGIEYIDDTYKTRLILLNGTPIQDYKIVYSGNDRTAYLLANELCNAVESMCGRRLTVITDSRAHDGGHEIIVGYSKRLTSIASDIGSKANSLKYGEYLAYKDGNFVYLGGKSDEPAATLAAADKLIKEILGVKNPTKNEINLTASTGVKIGAPSYSIVTYNDGDNSYQNITDRTTILQEYMPDIIGFQETQTVHGVRYKNILKEYDYVLYDNDGTTYNSQPIYWKKSKFDCIDSGIQWISDTPDQRSKYAESEYTRSYTYAILKDKETGTELVVVNTHLDFDKVKMKQVTRLLELTAKFKNRPVVYLGDFNMNDKSDGYKAMYAENFIDSGRYLNDSNKASIDFCFVDMARIVPTSYKNITDHEFSSVASDHRPVYTEFTVVR